MHRSRRKSLREGRSIVGAFSVTQKPARNWQEIALVSPVFVNNSLAEQFAVFL